jgi:aryl-alcohol dehydrogenase-like predicted oxidoreductase
MAAVPEAAAAAAGEITIGDMTVRRIGFGAMRLTGEGIWGEPEDPANAKAVLRRALELGVNLIDTADSYGPEVSERLIREALHPYPDDLVIATKGGLTRAGPNSWQRDGRPEHLRSACEGSLLRLGLERIDLYQLHALDADVPLAESVGALSELRHEGKIRHIGLSNVEIPDIEQARETVPVVSVQNRYNLAQRESDAVIDFCEREEITFIPWFPVHAGALAQADGPLQDVASAQGASPSQVALAWQLQRSPVMLPIPGTSSIAHLEQNVAAASLRLTDEDLEAVEAAAAA